MKSWDLYQSLGKISKHPGKEQSEDLPNTLNFSDFYGSGQMDKVSFHYKFYHFSLFVVNTCQLSGKSLSLNIKILKTKSILFEMTEILPAFHLKNLLTVTVLSLSMFAV